MIEDVLERLVAQPQHDDAEHLDQAAIGIPDESGVVGETDQPCRCFVAQADVQHRVHHPRHRELCPTSARNQQRRVRVAERLARLCLDARQCCGAFAPHPVGCNGVTVQVGNARRGCDGVTRGDRDAEARHLAEAGSLASEQRPYFFPIIADGFLDESDLVERVDPT